MRRHVVVGRLLATTLGCHGTTGVAPRTVVKPGKPGPTAIETSADLVSKARLTGAF